MNPPASFAVEFPGGTPSWKWKRLLSSDPYSAAIAFVRGEFNISGDVVAAVRDLRNRLQPSLLKRLYRAAICRLPPLETYFQSRSGAAGNIRFHYDQSNEFYSKFLDSRLVYSAALFSQPGWSLDEAQFAKLDAICTKLDLRHEESFLDVGCGWGALMIHAVTHHGARATGCTLSRNQYRYVVSALGERGLAGCAQVLETDYRSLSGRFRKIASIGMVEHVGRRRLRGYFRTIHNLLDDGGLFINSGITRPQLSGDDAESYFVRNAVFPGGELAHLARMVQEAEAAGFEVLEAENIRTHYARTCREWVARLQSNAESCMELVGGATYRTWLLYLAASAVNFEDGAIDTYQLLMAKRARRK